MDASRTQHQIDIVNPAVPCWKESSVSDKPKTVPVDPYRRSPPRQDPPPNPHYPKPGPKPVPVAPHRRSPPTPSPTPKKK